MAISLSGVGREILDFVLAILLVWAVAEAVRNTLRAIRRDKKDRVLLFEALALGSFFLAGCAGSIYLHLEHPTNLHLMFVVIPLFAPFAAFTALAAYFAVVNWVRRKQ